MRIYLSFGLTLLFLVLSISIQFNTLIIPDLGWHLYVGQKLLAGKKLYQDYFEVNLPMIFYLTLIPALIAKITAFEAILTLKVFNVTLTALSLMYCLHIFKKEHSSFQSLVFLPNICFILFIIPICFPEFELGQKEHFFIVFCLPYLLSTFINIPKKHSFFISILAGVGFAIKPFFLIYFILNEFLKIVLLKNFNRTIFLTISLFIVIYYLGLYCFHPGYFDNILPLALNSYAFLTPENNLKSFVIYFSRVTIEIYGSFILVGLCSLFFINNNKIKIVLLSLIANSLLIVFIQQKCFWYHYLPVMSMSSLSVTLAMVTLDQHLKFRTLRNYLFFMWLIFTSFVYITYPLDYVNDILRDSKAKYFGFEDIQQEIIAKNAKSILIISNDISSSFPIVNYANVEWVAKQHSQQLLDGLNNAELSEVNYTFTLNYIVDDIVTALEKKPDLVFIREPLDEENTSSLAHFFNKGFTYEKFFKSFDSFDEIWKSYEYSHMIENLHIKYSVYLHRNISEIKL